MEKGYYDEHRKLFPVPNYLLVLDFFEEDDFDTRIEIASSFEFAEGTISKESELFDDLIKGKQTNQIKAFFRDESDSFEGLIESYREDFEALERELIDLMDEDSDSDQFEERSKELSINMNDFEDFYTENIDKIMYTRFQNHSHIDLSF